MNLETKRKKKRSKKILIGHGTFSRVFQDKHNPAYAIKHYRLSKGHVVSFSRIKEWSAMALFANCPLFLTGTCFFSARKRPILKMPLLAGHLGQLVVQFQDDVVNILYQILCGLRFLENRNLCHGDLKGANILVKDLFQRPFQITICDFGSMSFLSNKTEHENQCTVTHQAPETFRNFTDNSKIDIWAAGIVLADMYLFQTSLFLQTIDIERNIQRCLGDFYSGKQAIKKQLTQRQQRVTNNYEMTQTPISHGSSTKAKVIISKEPLDISWTLPKMSNDILNILESMLRIDPSARLSIAEILNHHVFKGKNINLEKEITNPLDKLRLLDTAKQQTFATQDREFIVGLLYIFSIRMHWSNPNTLVFAIQFADDFFLRCGADPTDLKFTWSLAILAEGLFECKINSYRYWLENNSVIPHINLRTTQLTIYQIEHCLKNKFLFTTEWMYIEYFLQTLPASCHGIAKSILYSTLGHVDCRCASKENVARSIVKLTAQHESLDFILETKLEVDELVLRCYSNKSQNFIGRRLVE
jgi:serine/threonine protein kinase